MLQIAPACEFGGFGDRPNPKTLNPKQLVLGLNASDVALGHLKPQRDGRKP